MDRSKCQQPYMGYNGPHPHDLVGQTSYSTHTRFDPPKSDEENLQAVSCRGRPGRGGVLPPTPDSPSSSSSSHAVCVRGVDGNLTCTRVNTLHRDSTLLSVDSINRGCGEVVENFSVVLDPPIEDAVGIRLLGIEVPNSAYGFSRGKNNIYFTEEWDHVPRATSETYLDQTLVWETDDDGEKIAPPRFENGPLRVTFRGTIPPGNLTVSAVGESIGNAMNGGVLVLATDASGKTVDLGSVVHPLNQYRASHNTHIGRMAITVDPTNNIYAHRWSIHHGEALGVVHTGSASGSVSEGVEFVEEGSATSYWTPQALDHDSICRMVLVEPSGARHTFPVCRVRITHEGGRSVFVDAVDAPGDDVVIQGRWVCELTPTEFVGNVAHFLGFESSDVGTPFSLSGVFWTPGSSDSIMYVTPETHQFLDDTDNRFLKGGDTVLQITARSESGTTEVLFTDTDTDTDTDPHSLKGTSELFQHTAYSANVSFDENGVAVPGLGEVPDVPVTVVADRKYDQSRDHRLVYLELEIGGQGPVGNVMVPTGAQLHDGRRYFARIQLPSGSNVVEFQSGDNVVGAEFFRRVAKVSRLTFRLYDERGALVDMEGVDYSMLLEILAPSRK